MQTFEYSPNNFEPYPKLISQDEIDRKQRLSDSLSKYDSKLSFSDLKFLNLSGTPLDTSRFYKHGHQNLYLRTRYIHDKSGKNIIEWTDVTNYFDWDQILLNPDMPIHKFQKKLFWFW